jgi:capsular polysaccharide transport system ATP-binding protein
MVLEIRDLAVRTRKTLTPVSYSNLNMRMRAGQHLAIMGPTGIDLLTNVICGANAPDSGTVRLSGNLSWPMPGAPFLHKHQTFIANARFVARLYEMNQRDFIDRVLDMAGIAAIADEQVSYCPKSAVSKFSFALAACLPFDIYLFTNTKVGDKDDGDKYQQIIAELGRRSGILVMTNSAKTAQALCDTAYVLEQTGAVYYDDMDAALEHLERLTKNRAEEAADAITSGYEEPVSDDFLI